MAKEPEQNNPITPENESPTFEEGDHAEAVDGSVVFRPESITHKPTRPEPSSEPKAAHSVWEPFNQESPEETDLNPEGEEEEEDDEDNQNENRDTEAENEQNYENQEDNIEESEENDEVSDSEGGQGSAEAPGEISETGAGESGTAAETTGVAGEAAAGATVEAGTVGAEAAGTAAAEGGVAAFLANPVVIVVIIFVLVIVALIMIAVAVSFNAGKNNEDSAASVNPTNVLEYCKDTGDHMSEAERFETYGSSQSEVSSQIVKIPFRQLSGVKVHRLAQPCFEAAAKEIEASPAASKYDFAHGSYGGDFVWRCIDEGPGESPPNCANGVSNHSFGTAFDINTGQNGYYPRMSPPCPTDIPKEVVDIFKKYGFRWGGEYRNKCDAMHFEWMGRPGDPSSLITSGSGVVIQPSHQTDTSGGKEAERANDIARYALAAINSSNKKAVCSWPSQTSLKYYDEGSNACTKSTASGTGYHWEIEESNKLSPKVFVSIHLNGGTDGKHVQGYYHAGENNNRTFASDLSAKIAQATSLSDMSPGTDTLSRDCGSMGSRYEDSKGNPAFYSLDPSVNKATYRAVLEIGDNAANPGFWTEDNKKKVGEAIASVVNSYLNK